MTNNNLHVSYLGSMEEILEGSMDYPVCIFAPNVPTCMCKMETIALAMITETQICEQCKEMATGDCEGGLCHGSGMRCGLGTYKKSIFCYGIYTLLTAIHN